VIFAHYESRGRLKAADGLEMPGSEDANEYLVRAKQCLDMAREAETSRKVILLEMAQAWTRLAAQAERNERSALVYETARRSKSRADGAPKDRA